MANVPLGEPGLGPGGAPTKAYDQTPHVRRAFSYQDYAAYALLLRSIDGDPYTELWIEHHDDILATRKDGRYDLYQVKTRESNEPWMIGDAPIYDAIATFCEIEANHGEKIARYHIYSNIRPYIPALTAAIERKARSFHGLQHELSLNDPNQLPPEYAEKLLVIKKRTGANQDILLNILSKLSFVVGPALDSFRADLPTALCVARPKLKRWPITDVLDLQNELLRRVVAASSAEVPPLLLHTSPISAGGLPSAEISWRRVTTLSIRRKVLRRMLQRRAFRLVFAAGKIAIFMVLGGILFRPLLQVSPLQHALNVIQHSRDGVLPAEFNESVAIVRAAHKPLEHLNLDGANIECLDLSNLNMLRASGQSMHATGAIFDKSILAGAVLNYSELNGANFRNARMDQVFFQKSNMLVANLSAAEARNANFAEVTLTGANLSDGVFTGTDFSGAKLESVEMRNADFRQTELKDMVLTDANVSGADFTGAKHLTQEMLSNACISDAKPPIVDKSLKPTSKRCYATRKEQELREIRRFVLLTAAQMAVSQGYCKEFQHKFRPADSKLHPQGNDKIWYDVGEPQDVSPH